MASMENVIRGLEYHLKELSVGKTCFKCPYCGNNPCEIHLISDALELLKEQQPKTARWEKRTGMMPPEYHGHYWCSNCEWHGRYNEREADYKFCPACGAKMTK